MDQSTVVSERGFKKRGFARGALAFEPFAVSIAVTLWTSSLSKWLLVL